MSNATETYTPDSLRNTQDLRLIFSDGDVSVNLNEYTLPSCQIIVRSSDNQVPSGIIGTREGDNVMLLTIPTSYRNGKVWIGTYSWGIEVDGAQSDFNIDVPGYNFNQSEAPIRIEAASKKKQLPANSINVTGWDGSVDFTHVSSNMNFINGESYDPFIHDRQHRLLVLAKKLNGLDKASRRMKALVAQAIEVERVIDPGSQLLEGEMHAAKRLSLIRKHLDRLIGISTIPNAHVFEGSAKVHFDKANLAQGLVIQSNTLSYTGAGCIIDSVDALRGRKTIGKALMYNSLFPEFNAGITSLNTPRRKLAQISDVEASNIQTSFESKRDTLSQDNLYVTENGELLLPPAVLATVCEYYNNSLGNSIFVFTFPDEDGGILFFLSVTTNSHDMWEKIKEVMEAA